jgi:hypothetical protein
VITDLIPVMATTPAQRADSSAHSWALRALRGWVGLQVHHVRKLVLRLVID